MTAGYVLNRYVKEADVLSLNWLPIREYIDYNSSKLAFNALNDKRWPDYLSLELLKTNQNLRTDNEHKIKGNGPKTFSDQMTVYNNLPKNIRKVTDCREFFREARRFYADKALARTLSV